MKASTKIANTHKITKPLGHLF